MLQKIMQYFNSYVKDGICIAYSGGVDSSLLLKAACLTREERIKELTAAKPLEKVPGAQKKLTKKHPEKTLPEILAVVAETRLHPHEDTLLAQELARSMGATCVILQIDELEDPRIKNNPVNRCYLCKRLLFSAIQETARSHGCLHVFDGTNLNDTAEYRPGLAALEELNVHSPLKDLNITKEQVRNLSRNLGLSTSEKPSAPCLATRLPYGAPLDYELLDRLHSGETFLRKLGFFNVRLRYHAPVLRIEVDVPSLNQIIFQRERILQRMKSLGFSYITLDLEGFRSGSMDIGLSL